MSTATAMTLVVGPDGTARCVYGEAIDLRALGDPIVTCASRVEPTPDGRWTADLSPVGGPVLGPFNRRSDALAAEVGWLDDHWLECIPTRSRWAVHLITETFTN